MTLYNISLLGLSERSYDLNERNLLPQEIRGEMNEYLNDEEKNKIIELLSDGLERGDVIHIEEAGGYRNDGKLIYDGTKLIDLYHDIDDYGSISPSFHVGDEFLANHWVNSIDHNSIIWIDIAKHREQLIKSKQDDHLFFTTNLGTFKIKIMTEEDESIETMIDHLIGEIKRKDTIPFEAYNYINDLPIDPYTVYYYYSG